jgi:hypothetical protein
MKKSLFPALVIILFCSISALGQITYNAQGKLGKDFKTAKILLYLKASDAAFEKTSEKIKKDLEDMGLHIALVLRYEEYLTEEDKNKYIDEIKKNQTEYTIICCGSLAGNKLTSISLNESDKTGAMILITKVDPNSAEIKPALPYTIPDKTYEKVLIKLKEKLKKL